MKFCPPSRFRHILAATLAVGSTFQITAPVWADGTAAGTAIKNTATGSFTDGTTTYYSTSNEVTIEVSEVAGIALTAQAPSVTNPKEGDTLFVEFIITNIGNDPTQFFIPGTATLSNSTAFRQNGKIQIVSLNGTPLTPVDVPDAGGSTATLLGNPTIPATTGSVTVRVPIQVLPGATTASTLRVSLGDTTPVDGQNVEQTDNNVNNKDVYTQDNANGVGGETNTTTPTTREAMATSAPITVSARLQSFAAILKAASYSTNSTPNNLADDVLTYKLSLKIDNPSAPDNGLTPSDLYGTGINVDNSTATPYVLVSDALPMPDKLQLGASATIAVPNNQWTPVYTQDPVTTSALSAKWVTARPTSGAPITRIGFIYNTTTAPLSKGTVVDTSNVISGFAFTLTPTATFTGGQIANIAQVFGQSQPGTVAPGTSTQIVYDESGDQTANNGLMGTDPAATPANNGGISDGVANPAADGTDPSTGSDPSNLTNTNQGSDTGANAGSKPLGGEDTVYTIAATPLNGPKDKPAAVGPTSTNDDYTNKSIVVPQNKPPGDQLSDAETPDFVFENTAQNTSASQQIISLLPTPPATATALLEGTTVTITDPVTTTSATYSYTSVGAGSFTFVSGTNGTSATNPVKLTIPSNGVANYTVTVNLPAAPQLQGFLIPITAFVDAGGDGSPTGDPSNITLDRLYTNYLSLEKKARILEANGTPVTGNAGNFTTVQADLSVAATPGRIIEYQITYRNISTTGGTDSVTLPANNLVIVEDGNASYNTWLTSTLDSTFSTAGGNGSATASSGTIAVETGGTPTDITKYTNTVTTVAPAAPDGTFTFRRKIK